MGARIVFSSGLILALLAGPVSAKLVDDVQRALRKRAAADRVGGLELAQSGVDGADRREKNQVAARLAKAFRKEDSLAVKHAILDFYLALRTDRALDRLMLVALDPSAALRKHLRELVRDHADPALFRAVVRTLAEDESWRLRAAMVDLLLAGARKRGRAPLITALGDKHPGVVAAAAEALERLTGKTFGMSAAAWRMHLEAEQKRAAQKQKRHPDETKTVADGQRKVKIYEGPIRGLVPTLYTIPIRTKNVILVVDMSSSMRKTARTSHFEAIKNAIFQLPTDVRINLLCFDHRLFFFGKAKELVPCTVANKAALERWLNDLPAGANTDVSRSLATGIAMVREALSKDDEGAAELFILTDGRETVTTMPKSVVQSQFERLPKKRAKVHIVVLGKHGTPALKRLAELSGGRYHETR